MTYQRPTKAVIPAAGLGTRFLPATKSVPKELLPIVDTPTIQLIAQEVVQSGLDTIVVITAKGKSSIEDHFDLYPELEAKLESEGKHDLLGKLRDASSLVRTVSVRQRIPRGLGHAVLCSKSLIGNEPFVVVLGDDLVDAEEPCTKQMIDVFLKHQKPVVALMEVPEADISKFGICGGKEVEPGVLEIDSMVEKPHPNEAPSNLAIVGRYILTPEIFDYLERTDPGKGGEIQLTDAMALLMKEGGFIGYKFEGERYDAGDKFGFIKANIAYALKDPTLRENLQAYLKTLV